MFSLFDHLFFSSVLCLSTRLSSRFRLLTPCPCVCSALLIVCPALIVVTCPSSPSLLSLCVPVSRCQFVLVTSMFLGSQQFFLAFDSLVLQTSACLTNPAFAFSLLDCLPALQMPACVLNPDLTHTEPCRRLLLVGFVCPPLDCLSVYWTLLVKDFDYSLPLSLSRAIWVLLTTTPITIRSPKSSSQPYHI